MRITTTLVVRTDRPRPGPQFPKDARVHEEVVLTGELKSDDGPRPTFNDVRATFGGTQIELIPAEARLAQFQLGEAWRALPKPWVES